MDNTKLKQALEQIERLKEMVTEMGGNPEMSLHESFIKTTCADKWRVVVRESSNVSRGHRSASYKNVYIINGDGYNVAQVYSGGCKEHTFFIAHLIAAIPALLWTMQYIIKFPKYLGKSYKGVKMTTAVFYKKVLGNLVDVVDRCDPQNYEMRPSNYKGNQTYKANRYMLQYKQDIKDTEQLIKRGDIKVPVKW